MKTFNKSDLITWFNRDQAEVGKEYYFASCLSDIQNRVNDGKYKFKLRSIDENRVDQPFECDDRTCFCFACILPVDKVIEKEPEKKYRPFKNFKELFNLLNDMYDSSLTFSETECIYDIISDNILNLRSKINHTEYYDRVVTIVIEESGAKICTLHTKYANFSDMFEEFEIKIDGEWLPFGIPEE